MCLQRNIMIIIHVIYFKHDSKINSMQIIFFTNTFIFSRTKKFISVRELIKKNVSKLSVYSDGYTPFCFNNLQNSPLYISKRYLANLNQCIKTRIHKLHAVNKRQILVVKAVYLSNLFGITLSFTSNLSIYLYFTSNLPICCIIKWLS